MIYFMLFLGTLVTIVQVTMSYSSFKTSSYFFTIFVLTSVLTNLCWATVAKFSTDNVSLLKVGSIWDLLMGACWLLLPVLFFNVNLSWIQKTGLFLTLVGSILINMENL